MNFTINVADSPKCGGCCLNRLTETPETKAKNMKTPFLLTALRHGLLLLLLGGVLHALPGRAQTPQFMTYQGYLTDQNGNALATNGPQAYDVVFRIWPTATGGQTPLYGELQTVTVANGYFSVLLGQGNSYVNAGNTDPRPPLSTVFTNASGATNRYVEMTVKGLNNGADVVILPRLQLVTAPYAFMAANANALVSPTTGNTLISSSGTNIIVNGPFAANTVTNTGNFTDIGGGIYMDNGQQMFAKNNTGTYEPFLWPRWTDNTMYLNYGSAGFNIRNNNSVSTMWMGANGNVGINNTAPEETLSVGNFSVANQFMSVKTGGGNLWEAGLRFRHFNDTDGFDIVDSELSGSNGLIFASYPYGGTPFTAMYLDRYSGDLGIGTTTPAYKLDVNGVGRFSGAVQVGSGISTGLYGDGSNVALRTYSGGGIYFQTINGGSTPMYISPSGLVGINTVSPNENLTIANVPNYDNGMRLTGNSGYGTGMALESTASGGHKYVLTSTTSSANIGAGGFGIYDDTAGNYRFDILPNGNVGIGTFSPSTLLEVGSATCNGSTWVNASDRNLKQDFSAINAAAVLAKVVAMPVQSWFYKAQPDEKHIGPVAQDFHAAFGLNGEDDKHITTVDESGVALAAIQGLNKKVEEENADKADLKARLEQLEAAQAHMAELEQEVADLKKVVAQLTQTTKDSQPATQRAPAATGNLEQ